METNFVRGLNGINKDYIGKYQNHKHYCELVLLGKMYNSKKKDVETYCPYKVDYKNMEKLEFDCCEICPDNIIINLSDSGNHIQEIIRNTK